MAEIQKISGLASILSSEPFPPVPMFRTKDPTRIAAEIEQFTRNIHIFLQKLVGRFTAENLISTFNQGSGFGFSKIIQKKFHYIEFGAGTIILDNSIDWRTCPSVYFRISMSSTSVTDLISAPDFLFTGVYENSGSFSGYPYNIITFTSYFGFSHSVTISTTGVLSINLDVGSSSQDFFIDITIAALQVIDTNESDYVRIGAGA